MNNHNWSLQQAIQERVELEDTVQWSERPNPPLPILKKIPVQHEKKPAYKILISILNP